MITASDIQFRLSVPSASAGNVSPQPNPNASLGKFLSTTIWAGGAANDLFDDVSAAENLAGHTDYRCLFVCNIHASLTLYNAMIWRSGKSSDGSHIELGIDDHFASLFNQATIQAHDPGPETNPPTNTLFFTAPSKLGALILGDIAPGYCKAFWIKRVTTRVSAKANDGFSLNVDGATAP